MNVPLAGLFAGTVTFVASIEIVAWLSRMIATAESVSPSSAVGWLLAAALAWALVYGGSRLLDDQDEDVVLWASEIARREAAERIVFLVRRAVAAKLLADETGESEEWEREWNDLRAALDALEEKP